MPPRVPRYSGEEFSRRGKEIYARVVRPTLTPDDLHRLAKTAEKYGQEVFPPDYFNK